MVMLMRLTNWGVQSLKHKYFFCDFEWPLPPPPPQKKNPSQVVPNFWTSGNGYATQFNSSDSLTLCWCSCQTDFDSIIDTHCLINFKQSPPQETKTNTHSLLYLHLKIRNRLILMTRHSWHLWVDSQLSNVATFSYDELMAECQMWQR